MSLKEKYPNPQRLFLDERDNWFHNIVNEFNIPLEVYSSIRNSQLGQLILMIQSNRSKMIRAGEDPGPEILDQNTISQLVPQYQILSQLINFMKENIEEFDVQKMVSKANIKKIKTSLKKVKLSDWKDGLLEESRIDSIYTSSFENFKLLIIEPMMEKFKLEMSKFWDKIKEKNDFLYKALIELFDQHTYDGIINKSWKREFENDINYRIFNEDTNIKISDQELQNKALAMHSFLYEFIRFIDNNEIIIDFPELINLLSLEMLIKIPYPEKSFIPVVRENINQLKKDNEVIEIFDLIFNFYQIYSNGINPSNPRIFLRMYKKTQSSFKSLSSSFWKKMNNENNNLISIIWSSFSISLAQLNNKINQDQNVTQYERQCYNLLLELDSIFWRHAFSYFNKNLIENKFSFWGNVVYHSNKQLKSAKDAIDMFNKFDKLLTENKIFTNKRNQKKLDVGLLDKYTLLQRIISYGVESRSIDLFPKLKQYNVMLEKLINEIDDNEISINVNIEREREAILEINNFIDNPDLLDKLQSQ